MSGRLTISEAKDISITRYLSSIGQNPVYYKSNLAWYRSSIGRNGIEKTPSLAVDLGKNRFCDYGIGLNGDVIDLVCAIHNVNKGEAITILSKNATGKTFSFKENEHNYNPKVAIEVVNIKPLQDIRLVKYLNQRQISVEIANRYCKEVHYRRNGRVFFSIGFQNDKGGWELRTSNFKSCLYSKYISTIPGETTGVNIFEGFMDFLSCLTYYKTSKLKYTTIVLNSVTNYHHIKESLMSYKNINLFLDNDPAGEKLAAQIIDTNSNALNISKSIHPKHKDFNDFICNK